MHCEQPKDVLEGSVSDWDAGVLHLLSISGDTCGPHDVVVSGHESKHVARILVRCFLIDKTTFYPSMCLLILAKKHVSKLAAVLQSGGINTHA
jgi:hypothetical protein